MKKVFLPFLLVLALAHSCLAQQVAPAPAETSGAPAMIMRQVLPSDTDKAIDNCCNICLRIFRKNTGANISLRTVRLNGARLRWPVENSFREKHEPP